MDHFSSPQKHFLESNFISKNIFHHHRTFNLNYLNFENFFFLLPSHIYFSKTILFISYFLNYFVLPSLYHLFNHRSLYINFQFFFLSSFVSISLSKLLTLLSQRIISNIIKTFPYRFSTSQILLSQHSLLSPPPTIIHLLKR